MIAKIAFYAKIMNMRNEVFREARGLFSLKKCIFERSEVNSVLKVRNLSMRKNKKSGFTLTEIMFVVFIISFLLIMAIVQ